MTEWGKKRVICFRSGQSEMTILKRKQRLGHTSWGPCRFDFSLRLYNYIIYRPAPPQIFFQFIKATTARKEKPPEWHLIQTLSFEHLDFFLKTLLFLFF